MTRGKFLKMCLFAPLLAMDKSKGEAAEAENLFKEGTIFMGWKRNGKKYCMGIESYKNITGGSNERACNALAKAATRTLNKLDKIGI